MLRDTLNDIYSKICGTAIAQLRFYGAGAPSITMKPSEADENGKRHMLIIVETDIDPADLQEHHHVEPDKSSVEDLENAPEFQWFLKNREALNRLRKQS